MHQSTPGAVRVLLRKYQPWKLSLAINIQKHGHPDTVTFLPKPELKLETRADSSKDNGWSVLEPGLGHRYGAFPWALFLHTARMTLLVCWDTVTCRESYRSYVCRMKPSSRLFPLFHGSERQWKSSLVYLGSWRLLLLPWQRWVPSSWLQVQHTILSHNTLSCSWQLY